jgi:hypothetical protein
MMREGEDGEQGEEERRTVGMREKGGRRASLTLV